MIEYIKSSIEILMNLKLEEHELEQQLRKEDKTIDSEASLGEPPKDYEQMLHKLEGEVRNHIRVE